MGGRKAVRAAEGLVHPNSRVVRQLQRQTSRNERNNERAKKRHAQDLLEAARFFWFREQCMALGRLHSAFSMEEAQVLTQLYVERNDAELVLLKSLRNPTAGRIKKIEALKESETDAFESAKGIVIPDITDKGRVEILTEIWDGGCDTRCVVPRLHLTRSGVLTTPTAVNEMRLKLTPIDLVREKATSVTPKKALKFRNQKRTQSVKTTAKMEDITSRSKLQNTERQQKRLKEERKALINSRRSI
ncbi:hypothetical protein DQ04_00741120 [Trypanosoma grayi]|uniref:hypothetical protein n=1 Tax=Trypanosoma grayi TaxID=71804 RepID=UPI0004F444B9|nr:hypothetical protein DQ04_00741120 [Trypanosoma grayi]KEG13868.1 hypothetical protein DQ04_00741120 [Trypanosoma grayi]